MVVVDEYRAVAQLTEKLLSELDRLHLGIVAVHFDLGLRKLEDLIIRETNIAGEANVD